jgi:hypothetical protein
MPQLKQPMRLEKMGIKLHINKYCGKWEKWMEDLAEATRTDNDSYEVVVRSVLNECSEMEAEISKLPPGILKSLSNRLAKKIAKLICTYDHNFPPYTRRSSVKRTNDPVCKAAFRSVLTRFVERFDTRLMENENVQLLLVQNLDSVSGLVE